MGSFIRPATNTTPGIWFEPAKGRFELTGNSIPENATEFYLPVIQWLERDLPELRGEQVLHMRLAYFNSTSLKALYQMLKCIKEANRMGSKVSVRWYSEADDELLIETVATLSEMLDMPMAIIGIDGNEERAAL